MHGDCSHPSLPVVSPCPSPWLPVSQGLCRCLAEGPCRPCSCLERNWLPAPLLSTPLQSFVFTLLCALWFFSGCTCWACCLLLLEGLSDGPVCSVFSDPRENALECAEAVWISGSDKLLPNTAPLRLQNSCNPSLRIVSKLC